MPTKQPTTGPIGFYIAGPSASTVTALQRAIVEILKAPYADQATKMAALETLGRGVTTNVSHCSVGKLD